MVTKEHITKDSLSVYYKAYIVHFRSQRDSQYDLHGMQQSQTTRTAIYWNAMKLDWGWPHNRSVRCFDPTKWAYVPSRFPQILQLSVLPISKYDFTRIGLGMSFEMEIYEKWIWSKLIPFPRLCPNWVRRLDMTGPTCSSGTLSLLVCSLVRCRLSVDLLSVNLKKIYIFKNLVTDANVI